MTAVGESPLIVGSQAGAQPAESPFGLPAGWWPVAHSEEVRHHPGAFRLGSQDLAIYRDLSGTVRAVADRCPHRRLPLSMGRLTEDGSIQCRYHGWCFDGATGRCTAIPNLSADERIPNSIRVRAYSAAENIAELMGYDLRTDKLAPPVGPPTGEEPDEGTTMYDASVADGLVFVWTGAEPPTAMPESASTMTSKPTDARGTLQVRAPYIAVADAIILNPGSALGLGALIGAGDELCSPVVTSRSGIVSVQRERYTYDLPRASTFEPVSHKVTTSTITTVADTGLTRVEAPGGRRTPGCEVTIALTPIDTYRTVLRWRAVLTGPGRRFFSLGAHALSTGYRLAGRASDGCEALSDSTSRTTDPGVRALRRAREETHTRTSEGAGE
jgi:nitrite reductase/ring-hydroxylating ferredoxin subunit